MLRSPSFYSVIAYFSALLLAASAHGASFEQTLYQTLQRSPLSPIEKLQHMFNRLGYGVNGTTQRFGSVLKYSANGQVNEALTDAFIASHVARMLERRVRNSKPAQDRVVELFPAAAQNYLTVSATATGAQIKIKELAKSIDEEFLKKRLPVPEARAQELVAAQTAYNNYLRGLRETEQAEQVIHALIDNAPLVHVLHDFWFNHFNVSTDKVPLDISDYRDTIAGRMHGKFADLLKATAKHPAMLIYLDNYLNRVVKGSKGAVTERLNENYAREIMELHTLGMTPSGSSNPNQYNQADVVQAARLLTGWSVIHNDGGVRRFNFVPSQHAPGDKKIMGNVFPEGIAGGERFMEFLARHPRTARHIATKLTKRFVREDIANPEAKALIDELTQSFLDTDGYLPYVYADLISSPQFWSRGAYQSKIKSPFVYNVSALRATGIISSSISKKTVLDALSRMSQMGQVLQNYAFPTGYPEDSQLWGGSGVVGTVVQSGFQLGAYSGQKDSAPGRWADFLEDWAAEATTLQERGARAGTGAYHLFDGTAVAERAGYPVSVVGPNGALIQAGRQPDRDKHGLLPVRSVMGLILGSAGFYKF